MATTETLTQLPLHPRIGYEHSDAAARRLVIIGVSILVGTWICISLLYFFFAFLQHHRAATTAPAPARANGRVLTPPEPRIQAAPELDLQSFKAYEDKQLSIYGWADRKAGMVTMPIDRALELTAQRGIPPQKAPASLMLYPPSAGTRRTGFEGKVEPEPR